MFELFTSFKNKTSKQQKPEWWVERLKKISVLSNTLNKTKKELKHVSFELLNTKKDEMFISFADFISIINSDTFNIEDFFTSFVHKDEISNNIKTSFIEVYPIVEDGHVILCPDIESCKKHKNNDVTKIKIVSIVNKG